MVEGIEIDKKSDEVKAAKAFSWRVFAFCMMFGCANGVQNGLAGTGPCHECGGSVGNLDGFSQ